jgi:hypothetical protein
MTDEETILELRSQIFYLQTDYDRSQDLAAGLSAELKTLRMQLHCSEANLSNVKACYRNACRERAAMAAKLKSLNIDAETLIGA